MSQILVKRIKEGECLSEKEALEKWENKEAFEALPIEEMRLVGLSLWWHRIDLFAKHVCKRWTTDRKSLEQIDSPEFHKELWELARTPQDLLAIIARGHGKTTALSKILVLWLLLFEVEPSILLLMSKGLGEKVVGDIRQELERNVTIRTFFGSLVPRRKGIEKADKWRQRELTLTSGVELKTITKGEPIRGRRPTKIIIDDPEEYKDVKNPQIALEFYVWVFTSVYETLEDWGSMLVLGTILSHNCFANTLKQDAVEKDFKVVEYPAILGFDVKKSVTMGPDGKLVLNRKGLTPLWEEAWSLDALEKRLRKVKLAPFLQEYMNIPMRINGQPVFGEYELKIMKPVKVVGGVSIFRELFEEVAGKRVPKYDGSMGIDVAFGKMKGDFSTVIARSVAGELLMQFRGKLPQEQLCKIVSIIRGMLKTSRIVPEVNVGHSFLNASRAYSWHTEIYRKMTFDKVVQKETEELGWHTNSKTKPLMISDLDAVMREPGWEVSAEEAEEILHYYYDEKGGMNAIAPYHDDLVIADSLAEQGRKMGIAAPLLGWL